mmetsp:Transcript_103948/g.324029  ORF Transcript_103948/g.324029 Transcript_103948/m.324029 type:complete len:225 (-) Transcript_103948:433-1107(-)
MSPQQNNLHAPSGPHTVGGPLGRARGASRGPRAPRQLSPRGRRRWVLQAPEAAFVVIQGLEGVECHVVALAAPPIPMARLLREQRKVVDFGDAQGDHALAHVDVFLRRLLALLHAPFAPDHQGPAREELQRAVQATGVAAVVGEHAAAPLRVNVPGGHDRAEAPSDENGVGIGLHGPIGEPELPILDHLLPQVQKDGRVHQRVPLAALGTLEALVDHLVLQTAT